MLSPIMCFQNIILVVIFIIFEVSGAIISGSEEIVSPLRIAQCRSRCLQKFSSGQNKQNNCLQGPDCFMCWENCELLQANFQIWGSICQATDICFPGCQEACNFHRDSPQKKQTEPVIKARGEEVLKTSDGVARWPEPSVSTKTPFVYIVMRKNPDATWTQIIQTVERSIALAHDTITANLRVLVVNPDGLVTMYSPVALPILPERINDSIVSRIMAGVNSNKKGNEKVSLNTPKSRNWILKEESLIHQKILVLAEVSWEPRMRHGFYLVTWEVDGGGLKGNLFTDSTSVTLSLWPDTVYHIQVGLMSKNTDKTIERSELLVLDTHKARQVNFDIKTKELEEIRNEQKKLNETLKTKAKLEEKSDVLKYISNHPKARKIFQDTSEIKTNKSEFSLEQQVDNIKANLKKHSHISSSLLSVLVKRDDSFTESFHRKQDLELVLGSIAAVILFILISLLLVIRSKHLYDDNDDNKNKLIDNKNNKLKPIILLTEPKGNDQYSLQAKDNQYNTCWSSTLPETYTTLGNDISNDSFIQIIENSSKEVQV